MDASIYGVIVDDIVAEVFLWEDFSSYVCACVRVDSNCLLYVKNT